MDPGRVVELAISGAAEDKLWSHGITTDQALAVLLEPSRLLATGLAAPHPIVFIERDEQRGCLALPIMPTDDPLTWRVVIGRYCKRSEAAKRRQQRSIMDESTRYDSTQEPPDDEERELMDPDFWDWDNAAEMAPVESPFAVLPIRLTYEEHRAIGQDARSPGLKTHAFIKHAALGAAHGDDAAVETTVGGPRAATA